MNIGKPKRVITITPLENPVPRRREQPERPIVVVPEREKVAVPT